MYTSLLRALALQSFAASTYAFFTLDDLSFGHHDKISPSGREIPGWKLSGEGHRADVLSDRIMLTPPYPGNKRGSLWVQKALDKDSWAVDFEFRVSGQERGGGNLQIWLTKDGANSVGQSSIYMAPRFDGLALVVDQYGGQGGSIRGFLNDGQISFRDHHSVDSLAFGQCNYAFRNRGMLTHLQLRQMPDKFQVYVDSRICFESDKIQLPSGYYFGVTAASAENPDSFEVHSFIVSSPETVDFKQPPPGRTDQEPLSNPQQTPDSNFQATNQQTAGSGAGSGMSEEQMNDLRNRLAVVDRRINDVFREVTQLKQTSDQRHEEIMARLRQNNEVISGVDRLSNQINQVVMAIQRDVEGRDYQQHLSNLQDTLQETKAALSSHLPQTIKTIIKGTVPSLGVFVFIVVGFQGLLAASYFVYKRRRNNMPKKFL